MNAAARLLAPDVLRTLGLSLLHFLWQGAALAALAAAALSASRKAATRYAIAIIALVLMVSAPVATFVVLHNSTTPVAPSAQIAGPAVARIVKLASQNVSPAGQTPLLSGTLLTAFVELWFVGVLLFSLRTAGGFFLVARLRRRDSKPMSADLLALCREMQKRLGITRAIRYCESLHLDAPAVVGWFRPAVLPSGRMVA